MKIIAANIRNFKLLRKIDLTFSVDPKKPLTVIRAENGFGKTSTLHALRWGLYGQDVLEDVHVRLSPSDWPEDTLCKISVEIDFVHTEISMVDGEMMTSTTDYRLKREVQEKPIGDNPNRDRDRVILFEKNDAGFKPIPDVESRLDEMLPKEMIDIFFTDGDSAMTFISPNLTNNAKSDKVKGAIRSLLGLNLLEKVEKRLSNTQSEVNKKITKITKSSKLISLTKEIEDTKESLKVNKELINTLNSQIDNIDKQLNDIEKELTQALIAGSYEELARQRENYQKHLDDAVKEEQRLKIIHQELFKEEILSWEILEPIFVKGFKHLGNLHEKGIIPSSSVPVLKERIDLKECICGADLSEGTMAREAVKRLIELKDKDDIKANYLSPLYYESKGKFDSFSSEETKSWNDYYNDLKRSRLTERDNIKKAEKELKIINTKLSQIDVEEIEQKLAQKVMLSNNHKIKTNKLYECKVKQKEANQTLQSLEQEQKIHSKNEEKLNGINAEKAVLTDLNNIVEDSLSEMHRVYLNNVSNRMNNLFLDMIGSDSEESAIFQKVQINSNYNITVQTKDNRTLNPDYEVNGASQRALTFAFIWALTEESGFVAPRVIDTPLGMMSGNVKRRVLNMISRAAKEDIDRQVILFLTQSEISHTEGILDKASGMTFTLINTDKFPGDLMNDPKSSQPEILLCRCSHREYCDQCQLNNYDEFNLNHRLN
ncbi:MAG: AAA family ATPase [Gammaproteobacteria bacterium]|nr:AAA family ATPase [Gammaproteobacteria bacterium]MCY3726918.1 AAA family ATPase [Paracoccaceae bacterium]